MRIVVVVKNDSSYKKIKQNFSEHEVLPNIPIYIELQEFVFSDEASFAIIEDSVHWRARAEALLTEYGVPYILFSGNFDELVEKVASRSFSNKPVVLPKEVLEGQAEEAAGLGNEESGEGSTETNVRDEPIVTGGSSSAGSGGSVREVIKYVDREVIKEVPKYIDRDVVREVQVEKLVEVPVEVKVLVEKLVEVPVEVKIEVPVERRVHVQQLRAMPKQLIVVGSLFAGAGSSFTSIALAKVLNALRVDTCVVEYPANEPYLYVSLDGSTHLPRDYSFIFPQIQQGHDIKKRTEEWTNEFITWMPSDPATGKLTNWTSEHMSKCLYGLKNAVTILDISTAWEDPALYDVILQADHALLVAGPEPARLLSSQSRAIKQFLHKQMNGKVKIVANFVPDVANSKTREWIDSLPAQTIAKIPGLPSAEMVDASWKGKTIFDDNQQLIAKFTDCLFPLIRQVVPKDYLIERSDKKSVMQFLKSKIERRGR